MYNDYTWTDEKYTIDLINESESDLEFESILGIIELSSDRVKKHYLDKISALTIKKGIKYGVDSFENRVIKIVLNTLDTPSNFSKKITYADVRLSSFSYKDEVTCTYTDSRTNSNRTVKFSLEKLLPSTSENTSLISLFKTSFDKITQQQLDKLFEVKERPAKSIVDELQSTLSLSPGFWPSECGNAHQYLFYVFYYRQVRNYTSTWVLNIKLENESDSFVKELFDFLYENNIDIATSPFTYRISVRGKYLANDYILPDEKILSSIEKWADTAERIKYLNQNGVNRNDCKTIELRKAFINNSLLEHLEKITEADTKAALSYIVKEHKELLPFKGEHQCLMMIKLQEIYPRWFKTYIDDDTLVRDACELNSSDYKKWALDSTVKIFGYNKEMPCKVDYDDIDVLCTNEDDYFYSTSDNKLYINTLRNLSEILFEVAKENKTQFKLDDYRKLFLDNKISVSKEVIEEKDKVISKLQAEKDDIESILRRYKQKYGDIDVLDTKKSSTISISKAEVSNLSQQQKMDAQLEAQKYLRDVKPKWTFPDNYAKVDEEGKPYCFSTFYIIDEMRDRVAIVLKSYKLNSSS